MITFNVKTAPTAEPVSSSEAKLHLRVDASTDDTLIAQIITAAREWCEAFQNRCFITQTLTCYMDEFPDIIDLPRLPVQSVSSVKYLDEQGVQQTLSASLYRVDVINGRMTPAYGESWPCTRVDTNAVEIEYIAGYGAAAAVPASVKQAMLLLIGHFYENREAEVIGQPSNSIKFAAEALLTPNRTWIV
jgi:uncharacterized phiE125 gp8 family phage protein